MWSYSAIKLKAGEERIARLGVNFGAPGDRIAANGTLWLDYPSVGGTSPAVSIKVGGDKLRYYRQHSTFIDDGETRWVAASGVEGAETVTINLNQADKSSHKYTVKLHFADPDESEAGRRVFDIALQGQRVAKDVDVAAEAAGRNREIVKEFRGVKAAGSIEVGLSARVGRAVLSGIEIVTEGE